MKRLILKNLQEWRSSKTKKPLIVDGVRQVGKTYILQEFGKGFAACHYFNFEKEKQLAKIFEPDLDPKRIVKELALAKGIQVNSSKDLVIFDEIQECPKALTSLKYFNEELPELALSSAGSLLGVHLNGASFPVGKVDLLNLRPMNFEEFLMALGEDRIIEVLHQGIRSGIPGVLHDKLWGFFLHYLVVGGLPEVVVGYRKSRDNLVDAFAKVREIQNNLITGYLADMAKHSGKVNAMHLERTFKSVPEQLSREQDGSAPKFKFKGIVPNVRSYERLANVIDWLEKAGLVIKVPICNKGMLPFSAYTKENTFKLFMFDVGILGALSNLSPKTIIDYEYGTYKGYFAENFVLQELYAKRNETVYSWQENTAQIEFLAEEDGKIIPIEVKAGNSIKSKSLGVFFKKYNPETRIRVTGLPLGKFRDGFLGCPLYLIGFIDKLLISS
jgi:predicted AAA+ superfamily ATPase